MSTLLSCPSWCDSRHVVGDEFEPLHTRVFCDDGATMVYVSLEPNEPPYITADLWTKHDELTAEQARRFGTALVEAAALVEAVRS